MSFLRRLVCAAVVSVPVVSIGIGSGGTSVSSGTSCPPSHLIELTLHPGGPGAEQISVCTNDTYSSVWFHNFGEAVWRITSDPGGARVDQHTWTGDAMAGRDAIAVVHSYAVLGPDTWLTVHRPPGSVWIEPDPWLTSVWMSQELAREAVEDVLEAQVELSADELSGHAGAIATCAIGAVTAVEDVNTLRTDDDRIDQILAGAGLVLESGQCLSSLASLGDDVDQAPAWRRALSSWGDDLQRAAWVDDVLDGLNKMRKFVTALTVA